MTNVFLLPSRRAPPHLRKALERVFGYPDFRPGQGELVGEVMAGRDVLGVLPTGGGKSVCYMLPAAVLDGMVLVVSPLLSLMADQVSRAREVGLRAESLDSTRTADEKRDIVERARDGSVDILFLSPERLGTEGFAQAVAALPIELVAIDEAHCIAQWGHDFRPAYLRIGTLRPPLRCPMMALTATATPEVRDEIIDSLGLVGRRRYVGSFDRPNLAFRVQRLARPRERWPRTLEAVGRAWRSDSGSTVVYAGTRREVERLRDGLARVGYPAAAYHGGMRSDERAAVQDAFMQGEVRLVVATNAFGMGVDKSDVRLVVHWQLPGTLEAYYQEAGRAGRDGLPGRCEALYLPRDLELQRGFIDRSRPPPRALSKLLRVIRRAVGPSRRGTVELAELAPSGAPVDPEVLLGWVRALEQEGALRILGRSGVGADGARGGTKHASPGSTCVDLGVRRVRPTWARARTLRGAALASLRSVVKYATTKECRTGALLQYFGEADTASRCGRCDRCAP